MYGIEAINEADGWAMALLGILVVFFSLLVLSLIISQLHRILAALEKPARWFPEYRPSGKTSESGSAPDSGAATTAGTGKNTAEAPHPPINLENIGKLAEAWSPLLKRLDDPFQLADLYRIAAENDFPHPHLSITRMRQKNILAPVGNRLFTFCYSASGNQQDDSRRKRP